MDVSEPTAEQLQTRTANCKTHGDFESRAITLPTLGNKPGKPAKVIWSKCPACARETAEREATAKRTEQEQARQQRIEDRLNRAGIPKRFRECSFENYVADSDAKRHALSTAREFAENFPEHARRGSTLVFAGNVGTGKVHLAMSIAQHIIGQGHSAFFATAREIVLMLRARWDDRTAPSELEVLRMLTKVSLLVIDEIGIQFNTDAERDQLFGVIDGRYRELMPTIVTANLSRKALQQTIGERSYSRLREEGNWVPFDWEDFRGQKRIGR
ncbi:DNA replication protein DnaC [Verminephrobacter aporrectodeae subsp. tuberculatae]|uniref:DNA replication protein DnaC n=1 Tax=Verminephrobacter aporrectodeae subsp. tuberculatae TaxID=1110392 RepID=A0ABT3KZI6_9BURK|nr:ATP-binding protein [Verminephrobacter aporrectodeae]MCW5323725.1 DNA replication protein DnaC [Verminephrobacter aporrectodeae subsp. tuberculatae]